MSSFERPLPTVAALLAPSMHLAPVATRPSIEAIALCRAGPPPYLRLQKLQN
jgi:hypothetical protein